MVKEWVRVNMNELEKANKKLEETLKEYNASIENQDAKSRAYKEALFRRELAERAYNGARDNKHYAEKRAGK